jgi:hypothetical protein
MFQNALRSNEAGANRELDYKHHNAVGSGQKKKSLWRYPVGFVQAALTFYNQYASST